MNLVLSGKF